MDQQFVAAVGIEVGMPDQGPTGDAAYGAAVVHAGCHAAVTCLSLFGHDQVAKYVLHVAAIAAPRRHPRLSWHRRSCSRRQSRRSSVVRRATNGAPNPGSEMTGQITTFSKSDIGCCRMTTDPDRAAFIV